MTSKAPYLFISYREADTGQAASRLYADLEREMTSDEVFLDTERIEGGDLWSDRLRTEAERASVMIVLVGERWLTSYNPSTGDRRLNEPLDWVRTEIEAGLQSASCLVVPVLVDGAKPLTESALQTVPSIAELAKVQALKLRRDHWKADVENVLDYLCKRGFHRQEHNTSEPVTDLTPVEPNMRLVMDRIMPLRERKRGQVVVYGTVVLGTGEVAYGKGLTIQLAMENLSPADVVVRKLDLVVDEYDEYPLENYDYDVLSSPGIRLEIPASDLQTISLTPAEASGKPIALSNKRYFLESWGTDRAQHTLTALVVAEASGLWKVRVRATYLDTAARSEPKFASSDAFIIVLK